MYIIKTKNGLIELENYFLTSPITDLMGDGVFIRDENSFVLQSGSVERNIPYEEFVILVKKSNPQLPIGAELRFYLRDEYKNVSLVETRLDSSLPHIQWLMIRNQNFTELYSYNGLWEHVGGLHHNHYPIQGFYVEGATALDFYSYEVFSSPYTTFSNIPPTSECVLYENGTIVDTRIADDNGVVRFFTKYPRENAELVVIFDGNLFLRREVELIQPGDEYLISSHNLILEYHGIQLSPFKAQLLKHYTEKITLTNLGDEYYADLELSIYNSDKVEMSWTNDFTTSSISLVTNLNPYESKDFYVKIDTLGNNLELKQFGIIIGRSEP